MRKLLGLTLSFLLLVSQLWAQTKEVSGKVVDNKDGNPVAGATISVNGRSVGVTSATGEFSVKVPSGTRKLFFSSIGYNDIEVTIGDGPVSVSMAPGESKSISEVVVTGYTRERKSNFAGAATKIESKAINQVPNGSIDQILQGRSTGLYVTAGSGQPGSSANVIIRGVGSISGSNTPLYIMDGIPIESGVFASLSSSDIESVDVLKDASATALYGSRGANGVIVITTKRGKNNNKVVFGVNTQFGFSNRTRPKFEMMNSQQRIQYEKEIGAENNTTIGPGWIFSRDNPANAGLPEATLLSYDRIIDSLSNSNADWENIFFRQGRFQQHQFSASGGNENVAFYSSMDYYRQEGISIRSDLERYSFRNNVDFKSNRFSAGISSTINYSKSSFIESENTTSVSNPFASIYYALPYEQPYINGRLVAANNSAFYGGLSTYDQREGSSALERLLSTTNKSDQIKGVLGANFKYKLVDGLSAIATGGLDFRETMGRRQILPGTFTGGLVAGGQGSFAESVTRFIRLYGNAGFNYNKLINSRHLIDVNAIYENTKATSRAFNYAGFGIDPLLQNSPAGITPGSASGGFIPTVGGSTGIHTIQSLIVLGKYVFDNKYTLNASYRYDGTSSMPINNRWKSFYSVGASWNISKEDFMQQIDWVSDLQLRGSYGLTASPITGFNYLPLYAATRYAGVSGLGLSQLSNDDYDWEYTKNSNIGIDFSLFRRRLRGTIDLYNKKTENLFINQSLSATSGATSLSINAGELRNRGIELNLSGDVLSGKDVLWTVGGNISFNNNKITSLGQVNEFETGTSIIRVGLPIGTHFIPKWAGVDASNGNPLYYTKDGKITTTYDAANNSVAEFGSWLPKYTGGFNSSISYKGFSLDGFFSFAGGNKRFNNEDYFNQVPNFATSNQGTAMLRRWRKPGDVTDIQKFGTQRAFSSKDIQDASYLRLRNVNLSYSFQPSVLKKLRGISSLKLFIQGQNLVTWTNWTSFDPEDNNNIATFEYPAAKTVTFGLNLNF